MDWKNIFEWKKVGELTKFLEGSSVSIDNYWNQGNKTVSQLLEEIQLWETLLYVDTDTQKVIREIKVLNINVLYNNLKLKEDYQMIKDEDWNENGIRRDRDHLDAWVSEKIHAGEDIRAAIKRGVQEELDVILDDSQVNEYVETSKEKESPSYPWILTIYRILTTTVTLKSNQYNPDGYIEEQPDKNTYFVWENRI